MKIQKKFLHLLILILSGCSSVEIFSDMDRSANFSQYKSYAWLQRSDSVHNYWYDNPMIENNVKLYSNNEMKNRGYVIDINNPDLLLEYHTTVKKQHYTVNNPIYSNQTYNYNMLYSNPYNRNGYNITRPYSYNNTPYIIGYNNQQVEYNEETLIIDIIDRNINKLIWRGWSVGSIDNERSLEAQLPKDIKKIFSKYPVRPIATKDKKSGGNDDY